MTEEDHPAHHWAIVVADGEGDTATVKEKDDAHLRQLLRRGVDALFGEDADPGLYDLIIAGTRQDNLKITLADAGLRDHAEVVILPKDVSRG